MPAGFFNAYLFAIFNAFSFQIVLSSPMVLYAKSLGATATVLGIIAGMMPLLVIFQIPAAAYIPKVGYRRFVLSGWTTRVMFIFGMALIPLSRGFLNESTRLALLLSVLFGFNLSRGISSCAWLPWISQLIPPEIRGRYLARDAAWVNLASGVSFLLSALCLQGEARPWQFAALFGFSASMGAVSLAFLKRIPDAEVPVEERTSTAPVPWREIAGYRPFRKLVRMVVTWSVAYGGITAFTTAFLKTEAGMAEATILLVSSISFLGGLCSLWVIGSRLDKLGSKPVLSFAFIAWGGVMAGWCLVAGRVLEARAGFICALQFFMGLFAALAQMSNTRLAMEVIPTMGRNHFFALFSVFGNVVLGLSPILWGLFIDAIGTRHGAWVGLDWNRFSLFFAATAMVFVAALGFAQRLEEPRARRLEDLLRDLLIESPQRVWVRLWPRG
jgi:MFS family permease